MRVIGMAEMRQVFALTDALGLHREAVRVELVPAGRGTVAIEAGRLCLTLPSELPIDAWLESLRDSLPLDPQFASLRRQG